MSATDINSQEYWNGRFDKDWESNLGKEQSRFFARVALEQMPAWLRSTANHENWSVCDWGCAQGDGTDVIANAFIRERVTGIDFAESAVAKARVAYPALRFEAQDWIEGHGRQEKFDMVFSSNTLEHFTEPFKVLVNLFQHAEHCVVLTLPYRELDRISEHFFTFTAENIPLVPHPDWVLVHSAAVDCRPMEPTYWHGDQVILVYVHKGWAQSRKLALADGFLGSDTQTIGATSVPQRLKALLAENERLAERLTDRIETIKALMEQQLQQQAKIEQTIEMQRQVNELASELAKIKNSNSWRLTGPLRRVSRSLKKLSGN